MSSTARASNRHRVAFLVVLATGCSHAGMPAAPDGSTAPPDTAVGALLDASAPVIAPTTCGTSTCRTDQSCDQGQCVEAPCVGTQVPGDYADVQAAVTALAALSQDYTLCVGAGTFGGYVGVRADGGHRVTLIGRGAGQTSFEHLSVEDTDVRGISAQDLAMSYTSSIVASNIVLLTQQGATTADQLTVDGCRIGSFVANTYAGNADPSTFRIINSIVQPAAGAAAIQIIEAEQSTARFELVNNTIYGAVSFADRGTGTHASVRFANNIVTAASTALYWTLPIAVTHGNNALWGNVTQWMGSATRAPSDITQDCALDATQPAPSPTVGSPCRGAADASLAPPHDFWNVPRAGHADIGAVQGY